MKKTFYTMLVMFDDEEVGPEFSSDGERGSGLIFDDTDGPF